MDIGGFPKGLVVALILIGGTLLVILFNPPHRLCQTKVEMLKELQKGKIFPGKAKRMALSPKIIREVETCKLGNSPGACFEMFSTLRGLIRDLHGFPLECAEDLRDVGQVKGALSEGLGLLTQIAWGEQPPEPGIGSVQQGWLETGDIALFCSLKDMYVRFFGMESLDQLRMGIFSKLPGEAPLLENGACVNCDFRKTALQALGPEEIRARTLFAVRCELFR